MGAERRYASVARAEGVPSKVSSALAEFYIEDDHHQVTFHNEDVKERRMSEARDRERNVREALKLVASQRVVLVLQPGNVFVIENSPKPDWFEPAVQTALIRGWVAVLHDAVPSGQMDTATSALPDQMPPRTVYRLTEGGWSVIHGSHGWIVATFLVSFLAMLASLVAIVVAWPR